MRSSFFIGILLPAQRVKFTPACCPKPTTPHIATESVKLSDAIVDFWCENLRRFAENQPSPSAPSGLSPKACLLGLPDRGVTGGAAYDALVAATAAGCDAELVTCDRRALPVYERYGLRAKLLS
jgi:hypothetical protein